LKGLPHGYGRKQIGWIFLRIWMLLRLGWLTQSSRRFAVSRIYEMSVIVKPLVYKEVPLGSHVLDENAASHCPNSPQSDSGADRHDLITPFVFGV
jgi:hypothetical protein